MSDIIINFLWRLAERTGAQIVSFLVSIILARIIAPSDYGIIAIINVLLSFLQVFVDSGLGTALIQKREADQLDYSTVFIANILICIVTYILLFFEAPFLEIFFGIEDLALYFRVSGLGLLIAGLKNILQAYISKHMQFKKFFFATLFGTIVSAIVGVTMAINGMGIWALISQSLINTFIDTLVLWIVVKWRPSCQFSISRLGELFSFGWKVLVSALVITAYENIHSMVIGKKYSYEDLAYYDRGKRFPDIIIGNVNSSLDSVMFPAMSGNQSIESLRKLTQKSIRIATYVIAPMMIGMAAVGDTLISLLLTDRWLSAVPYLRIVCLTYIFYPLLTANQNAVKSLGLGRDYLKATIIKITASFICLIISMQFGVMAIALSLFASTFFSMIITSYPVSKKLEYNLVKQMTDISHILVLGLVMGIITWGIAMTGFPKVIMLFIQIGTGVLIYITGSKLFRFAEYDYIKNNIKKLLKFQS